MYLANESLIPYIIVGIASIIGTIKMYLDYDKEVRREVRKVQEVRSDVER